MTNDYRTVRAGATDYTERVSVAIWQMHPNPAGEEFSPRGGFTAAQRDDISTSLWREGPKLLQGFTEVEIAPYSRGNDYRGEVFRTSRWAWTLGPHVDWTYRREMEGGYLMVVAYPDGRRYVTFLPLIWQSLADAPGAYQKIRWCTSQIPSSQELGLLPPRGAFYGRVNFGGMVEYGYGGFFAGLLSPDEVAANFVEGPWGNYHNPWPLGPSSKQVHRCDLPQYSIDSVAVHIPNPICLSGARGDVALQAIQNSGRVQEILGIEERSPRRTRKGQGRLVAGRRPELGSILLDEMEQPEIDVTVIPPGSVGPPPGTLVVDEDEDEDGDDEGKPATGLVAGALVAGAALLLVAGKK